MSDHEVALGAIAALTEGATAQRERWLEALRLRDDAIREAIRDDVTMYRIAKATGLSEQAVRKIRDR